MKVFWLKLLVTWKNFVEYLRVVRRYYFHKTFRRLDIFLLRHYILQNPYRISRDFLAKRGEKDVYTYGETPLTTLEKIADACEIQATDTFFELGSGRGRSCFWLHCFKGCRVVGVEFIPTFVHIAAKVQRRYCPEGVEFVYRDILDVDLSEATVIYFYGTSASRAFIEQLIDKKFKDLRVGTKIITVSYPLTAYANEPLFALVKSFSASFTWGGADVFLQVRTSNATEKEG